MIKATGKTGGRESLLIYLLISSLLLVGGWKVAGAALYNDIKSLREEIGVIEEESIRLRELMASEEIITTAWAQWHDDSDRLHNLIPDQSELDTVLGNIEIIPEKAGAAVHSFSIDNLNSYENYSTARVFLAVSCCPATAQALLSELFSIPHIFSTESISWRIKQEGDVMLELAFRLFFFQQAEAAGTWQEGD